MMLSTPGVSTMASPSRMGLSMATRVRSGPASTSPGASPRAMMRMRSVQGSGATSVTVAPSRALMRLLLPVLTSPTTTNRNGSATWATSPSAVRTRSERPQAATSSASRPSSPDSSARRARKCDCRSDAVTRLPWRWGYRGKNQSGPRDETSGSAFFPAARRPVMPALRRVALLLLAHHVGCGDTDGVAVGEGPRPRLRSA